LLCGECEPGCFLVVASGAEWQLLELFRETLQLLDPDGETSALAWRHPFTTFLQEADNPADFRWRGGWAGTPALEAAARLGSTILEVGRISVPKNDLAELARQGRRSSASVPSPTPARVRLALRRASAPPRVPHPGGSDADSTGEAGAGVASVGISPATVPGRRRWWLIAAGVLLLTVGWLGWRSPAGRQLLSRLNDGSRGVLERQPSASGSAPSTSQPKKDQPFASSTTPGENSTGVTRGGPQRAAHPPAPRLPDALLFAGEEDVSIPLPAIPALEVLLDRLVATENPLAASAIASRWDEATLVRPPRGAIPRLEVDLGTKQLKVEEKVRGRILLDFSRRFFGRERGEPAVLRLPVEAARQGCALEFRPAPGHEGAFGGCWVVVIHPSRPPLPLPLSGAFLGTAGTNDLDLLAATLRERVSNMVLMPGWRLELRPFVITSNQVTAVDLFERWPSTKVRPLASADFVKLREFYADRRATVRDQIQRREREIQASSNEFGGSASFDPGFPLGRLIGSATNAPEFSFRQYLLSGARPASGPAFMDFVQHYVRAGGQYLPAKELLRALAHPMSFTNTLAQLEPLLGDVARLRGGLAEEKNLPPAGYFQAGWRAMRDLDRSRTELEATRETLAFCESQLVYLPDGLARTAHISLLAVRGREAIELIRFSAPPADSTQ
jgi:hypothetical protein